MQINEKLQAGDEGVEDSLFIPETHPVSSLQNSQRRSPPKDAREYAQREQEKRLEKERRAAQRRGCSKKHQNSSQRSQVAKKPRGGRISKNNKNINGQSLRVIGELFNSDTIRDRLAAGYHPEPQVSGQKNKRKLLEEILSTKPQDARYTAQEAGAEKRAILKASQCFGFGKVRVAENGRWKLNGMRSSLFNHQLIGAAFMVQRELSNTAPKGGINADVMGLGKTLQVLATILGNPPTQEHINQKQKSTLIVVPAAIIHQWKNEIEAHVVEGRLPRVLHYKRSQKLPMIIVQDQDIVLTTYTEVMRSFSFPQEAEIIDLEDGDLDILPANATDELGYLHQISWYRIVLDEAHAIKNYRSRTSIACQRLQGEYRWCLTGSPLQNSLEELYPYIRFLRMEFTESFKDFRQWFCNPQNNDDKARIDTLLDICMIRRTMKSTLLGRPVVSLPEPHADIQYVDLSREERLIYDITERRVRSYANEYFAADESERKPSCLFVLLLRLRQCASHPLMIEDTIKTLWTAEDRVQFYNQIKRCRRHSEPLYEQCKLWITEAQESEESTPFGVSSYGSVCDIDRYMKGGKSEKSSLAKTRCKLCSGIVKEPYVTDCLHIFCKDCLDDYMNQKAMVDPTVSPFTECPSCQTIISTIDPYKEPAQSAPDLACKNGRYSSTTPKARRKHWYLKGKDIFGFEPSPKQYSEWLAASDKSKDFSLFASSKTTALKAKLLKWIDEAPNDKIVIFCQFKILAMIVGRLAEAEGWKHVYYSSDMDAEKRAKAVEVFHENPELKIMIAGLKCGGQGLNLTAANRCISLDLWWNHAVEQQAFGRVFRLGQKKDTFITRICVNKTIEQRMLEMQMKKIQIIERTIEKGEMPRQNGMDVREIARLFGSIVDNGEGPIVIEADFSDDEDEEDENGDQGDDLMDAGFD
ncbi:SNF2 family N-terminal domain-containing protein [Xylogone sp. PMI_703]|nr:SNF2 family N-terminal domain-containing protein [Xylogone sp. PMI_703]